MTKIWIVEIFWPTVYVGALVKQAFELKLIGLSIYSISGNSVPGYFS